MFCHFHVLLWLKPKALYPLNDRLVSYLPKKTFHFSFFSLVWLLSFLVMLCCPCPPTLFSSFFFTLESHKAFGWCVACLSAVTLIKRLPYAPQAAVRLEVEHCCHTAISHTQTQRSGLCQNTSKTSGRDAYFRLCLGIMSRFFLSFYLSPTHLLKGQG